MKVYLCSFATNDLRYSIKRFKKQASELNFYEDIKIFSPKDLSFKKKEQINELYKKKDNTKNPYGFCSWKPEIILKYLDEIPNDCILQYSDIGNHLNLKGLNRLKEYAAIASQKNILTFQYNEPEFNSSNLEFQIYYEYEYTKTDVWKYLEVDEDSEILKNEQIWAGSIFLKNNYKIREFLKLWESTCQISELIDDSKSKEPNHEDFVVHRHDQSVFSILCKKNAFYSLSASESEWARKNTKMYWDHLENFPILAKRDKKLNFLKRALNKFKKKFFKIF